MNICIVQPRLNSVSETFIAAHAENLPVGVTIVHRPPFSSVPHIGDRPALSRSRFAQAQKKIWNKVTGRIADWEITPGYVAAFRNVQAHGVLAEYGPTGVEVMEACRILRLPLVVHFHGYDASKKKVLEQYQADYRRLFVQASAIVAVSRHMREKLIDRGAPRNKVFYNPYGVDCRRFGGANPASSTPTFIAVGRFVEKKAPHLTLTAFANVYRTCRAARLRMIGDGPMLGMCKELVKALGVSEGVSFLGRQPHYIVCEEMRRSRAFVQHSVEASDGDCEGTPVAVLEASASGLPVISTKHAGIPDVVVHGKTGLLVDERDVESMAKYMSLLAHDSAIAAAFGAAARKRAEAKFSMDRSISRLWSIIESSVNGGTLPVTDPAVGIQK